MITAGISIILGALNGILPDIIKEVRDSRSHGRELEFLREQARMQAEIAKAGSDNRLREIEAAAFAEEMKATREHLTAIIEAQSKPTGIRWIDGFNAVLRPMVVVCIVVLFMGTALPFTYSTLAQFNAGRIDANMLVSTIWGSLVGEAIQAVLGYLFGYRGAIKPVAR